MKQYRLSELACALDATVTGDDNILITSIATLKSAQSGQISFLSNPKYRPQLLDSQASAYLLREQDLEGFSGNAIVVKDPYVSYAILAQLLDSTPLPSDSIHPTAVIAPSATIGNNVCIGANTVIEADVVIGDNCYLGPNGFVGQATTIGNGTKTWANVSIYHGVIIGSDCLLHSGCVIGSDGFGFAPNNGQWYKIPQTGGVILGSRVEIGANTTIDRGALDSTEIGDGCILDNQVHIGHNVVLGKHCAVAANSAFAGSSNIGDHVIIGGACAISGHLTIVNEVTITGMSMVIKSIDTAGVYSSGMPAQSNREWRKNGARYRQLDAMAKRLKQVENQLKADSSRHDI